MPVVAQHVDERERLHEGRREQRQHGHHPEEAPPGQARAREPVRVREGERDGEDHRQRRDVQAVGDGLRDRRRLEVPRVVREPDEAPVVVERAPPQHLPQRVEDEQAQDGAEHRHHRVAGGVLRPEAVADRAVRNRCGDLARRDGHGSARGRRRPGGRGARGAPSTSLPSPAPRSANAVAATSQVSRVSPRSGQREREPRERAQELDAPRPAPRPRSRRRAAPGPTAISSGRMASVSGVPAAWPPSWSAWASSTAPARARPGAPQASAAMKFMCPTKRATNGRGRAACRRRPARRPARPRRGSSPRCGRPWRAPPPGRGSP